MSKIDFFEQFAHGLILIDANFRSTDQIKFGQCLNIGDMKSYRKFIGVRFARSHLVARISQTIRYPII